MVKNMFSPPIETTFKKKISHVIFRNSLTAVFQPGSPGGWVWEGCQGSLRVGGTERERRKPHRPAARRSGTGRVSSTGAGPRWARAGRGPPGPGWPGPGHHLAFAWCSVANTEAGRWRWGLWRQAAGRRITLSCRTESSGPPGTTLQGCSCPLSSSLKLVHWSEIKSRSAFCPKWRNRTHGWEHKEQFGATPADGARSSFLNCTKLYTF